VAVVVDYAVLGHLELLDPHFLDPYIETAIRTFALEPYAHLAFFESIQFLGVPPFLKHREQFVFHSLGALTNKIE